MKNSLLIFVILFINTNAFSNNYKTDNNIINLKYGFQLGDLIIIEDKIISDKKFSKIPELITEKKINIKLNKQKNEVIHTEGKYTFINIIEYQIFQTTKSGNYALPDHEYRINKEKILIPQKKYWFTRAAESKLNKVLINSVGQIKPDLIKIEYKYSYALFVIILLSSLIIIYKNYDSTYFSRMNGPFAKAHKKIKHLNKKKEKENYIQSILILTDAFNKTFNKNINNSNLNEFTKNNRNYQPIEDEIKIFVEVSSAEIYSSKTYFSKTRFNDIYNFSKLLRTIERKI